MPHWGVTLRWHVQGRLIEQTIVIPSLSGSTILWAVHEGARQAGAPLAEVESLECHLVKP